jgi:hypothetical protein
MSRRQLFEVEISQHSSFGIWSILLGISSSAETAARKGLNTARKAKVKNAYVSRVKYVGDIDWGK